MRSFLGKPEFTSTPLRADPLLCDGPFAWIQVMCKLHGRGFRAAGVTDLEALGGGGEPGVPA